MKLFSFRMRAISVFTRDTGMSTRRCRDAHALRIRVNMSAIGSVMLMNSKLLSYPETWGRWVVGDRWLVIRDFGLDGELRSPAVGIHQLPTSHHHDAFRTPGIIPDNANSRKQMRHRPNRRRNARDRPQRLQRL